MHQQKGKKIFIYLFFMILVGSINNIELHNYKILEIRNIDISGLNNLENSELKKKNKKSKFTEHTLIKEI